MDEAGKFLVDIENVVSFCGEMAEVNAQVKREVLVENAVVEEV